MRNRRIMTARTPFKSRWLSQRVTGTSVEPSELGKMGRGVESGVLVEKLLQNVKNGRGNLLKKGVTNERRNKVVEENCRVDKFGDGCFDDSG
jgi:hypothetical protein